MPSFKEQLKFMTSNPHDSSIDVFPYEYWTLEDFQLFSYYLRKGYLIPSNETNGFVWIDCDEIVGEIKKEYYDESCHEQYTKECDDDDCDKILDINTPIMCYMNSKNGDKTLCRTCYEDGNYKEDDENSDNEE
tara:strand:+ start:490 stop:888 length:399 start_codon:yes stop_codon:yes gene_type:complete